MSTYAEWKDCVIDALIVGHIYKTEHETNPYKALHDLIAWEVHIALDPAVSSEARALIDAGRREERERCAQIIDDHEGGPSYYGQRLRVLK